ncbi:hypothetical protein HZB93_01745 [Candidatus Falkowbacteria bacterium]|nr:hypothetical protein [Candidatus Falkowbacteria bacterium]
MEDRREMAKVFLADGLEKAYLTGFLRVEDIVAKILAIPGEGLKPSFVAGLKRLVGLHGFAKIVGPFYAGWHGSVEDNLTLFEAATKDFKLFVDELFKRIPHDETVTAFEEFLHTEDSDGHPVTWSNLVNAFPYRELDACVTESRAEATKAATEEADAPEAEVVEEELEVVEPTAGKPT